MEFKGQRKVTAYDSAELRGGETASTGTIHYWRVERDYFPSRFPGMSARRPVFSIVPGADRIRSQSVVNRY